MVGQEALTPQKKNGTPIAPVATRKKEKEKELNPLLNNEDVRQKKKRGKLSERDDIRSLEEPRV